MSAILCVETVEEHIMLSDILVMESFYAVFWTVLGFCISFSKGITVTSLYSTTQSAVLGFPVTLVCTWNHTEHDSQNESDIRWTRGDGDLEFIFNSESCVLVITTSGSQNMHKVSFGYGFLYQSLIFENITTVEDVWSCSSHGKVSNRVAINRQVNSNVRMSSGNHVVYIGSNITLTCSVVEGNSSGLARWFLDSNPYFFIGQTCTITLHKDVTDEHDILNRSTSKCTNSFQSVTITNVTMSDHNVTWQCSFNGSASNAWRVIVLDPDLPDNVSISRIQTDHNDNTIGLVCTAACEDKFSFSWDTNGSLSNIAYDRCKHICNQSLTIHVKDRDPDSYITCTVTNTRTGKTSSAQYLITRDDVTTDGPSTASMPTVTGRTTGQGPGLPIYAWGVVAGGGVIIIIVVVIVVWKKRSSSAHSKAVVSNLSSKPTPVMEDNVLYEHGGPEKRGSKLVLEDNILYELGDPVMENNVLYETGGPELNKQDMRESQLGIEGNVYEGCENKDDNEYHTIEPVVQTEDD